MNLPFSFIPVSLYDLAGLEAWLSAQAQKGLRPTHLGSYCTFDDHGAEGARYCIVPKEKGEPTQTLDGWDYALPLGLVYQVYTTNDPDLAPLPQDFTPITSRIRKSRRWTWIFVALLCCGFLFPLFYTSKWDASPNTWLTFSQILLAFTSWEFVGFFIAFAWMKVVERQETNGFLRDQTVRQSGNAVAPWAPSKRYTYNSIIQMVGIPILLVLLIVARLDLKTPLSEFDKPYVPLEQIEQVDLATGEEHFGDSYIVGIFEPDYGKTHYSILATSYYEVVQEGFEGTEQTGSYGAERGDGIVYSPDLEMTKLSLTLPFLSRWVAETVMDQYRLVNIPWDTQEVDYGDLDFVLISTAAPNGIWQRVALGRGREVAVFRYNGEMKLADHLDVLAEMVQ